MSEMKVRETADLTGASIAKDELVIRGAVLLGPVSANAGENYASRRYTAEAMRAAVPLYEGVRGFFNHEGESASRDVRDFAGAWRGVHYDESAGRLKGDFHIVDSEAGRQLADMARRFPTAGAGFSHDASITGSVLEDVLQIDKINRVYSVDVVATPATTSHFFEHEEKQPVTTPTTKTDEQAVEARVKLEAALEAAQAKTKDLESKLAEAQKTIKDLEEKHAVAETVALVSKALEGQPDVLAKRVRKMFEGKAATAETIEGAVAEGLAFLKEAGVKIASKSKAVEDVEEDEEEFEESVTVPRLDDPSRARPKTRASEGIHDLSADVFGALCGVDLREKKDETAKAS